MSLAHGTALPSTQGAQLSVRWIANAAIFVAVALGGFVMFEPGPYEYVLVALIPLFFLWGLRLRRSIGPLIVLMLIYVAGGFLATTQNEPIRFEKGLLYQAATLFLAMTAVWMAALLSEDPRRARVIEQATIFSGVIVALIGILAYFRLIPGAETFLLYGRARSTFQDPNVFGPFLMLPTLLVSRRLMTGRIVTQLASALIFAILALGIFLSFSRAAWGMLAAGLPLLAVMVSATAASNRQRFRLLGIAVVGFLLLTVVIAVAASIPAVQEILVQRARLVQDYDSWSGGQLGRFARHWVGFQMAMEHPLGIGPFEFPALFVEATHNSYLKALMEYGWLGFVAYMVLIVWTIAKAVPIAFRSAPQLGFTQCVVAVFLLHLLVGWIIDTDHWRHFYLIIGMIWGLAAAQQRRDAGRFAPD